MADEREFVEVKPSEEELDLWEQKYANLTTDQYAYLRNKVTSETGWSCLYDLWTKEQPEGEYFSAVPY